MLLDNYKKESPIIGIAGLGGGINSYIFLSSGGDYVISKSLRFNSGDSAYLSRTPSAAGNQNTWTWSGWIKFSDISGQSFIFGANGYMQIYFGAGKFYVDETPSGGSSWTMQSSQYFRDPSAWYHFVFVYDSTQSAASDKFKVYANGSEITEWTADTRSNIVQNNGGQVNSTNEHRIGRQPGANTYANVYLSDVHLVDGQALSPTGFGETDDDGVWQPKKFSGSHGPNGFHLDFKDTSSNAALGYDAAGSNNWTVNNLIAAASTANTSQTWSSSATGYHSGATSAFDGNLTTSSFASGGANANAYVDITAITASKVEVYISAYTSDSAGGFYYCRQTNNTQHTYTIGGSGTSLGWVTVYESSQISINRLGGARNSSGSSGSAQYGWKVDGVLLVDSGTSGFDPSTIDSLIDSPSQNVADETDTGLGGQITGNYATYNPVRPGSGTKSNGALTVTGTGQVPDVTTIAPNSGKWYAEIKWDSGTYARVGLQDVNIATSDFGGVNGQSYRYESNSGNVQPGGQTYSTYTAGDIIGIAFDCDAGKLWLAKNGTWQNSGNPASGTGAVATNLVSGSYYAPASSSGSGSSVFTLNAGQRAFAYTAPTGFKSLNTANLTATIEDGSKYFDTKLYTGNGSTQTISGYNFSPDFVWTKCRNFGRHHALIDVIRGGDKLLGSSQTDAEGTYTDMITAFNSDGFTLGADATTFRLNESGRTYAGWAWDAGDSNTTIAAGSLNSSAYDQTDWSGNTTATNIATNVGNDLASVFDGNLANGTRAANNGGTGTLQWSSGTIQGNVRVYTGLAGTQGLTYYNGSTPTTIASVNNGWNDLGNIDLTRLDFVYSGGNITFINAIELDGKLLVNSGVSLPNVPSIASQVRANPSAGFSIVSYTGNGVSGATCGHGLNAKPSFVMYKNRDASANFEVQAFGTVRMDLNQTVANQNNSLSTFTNTTFSFASGSTARNGDGVDYIAYCFAPVAGYSSMGSYVGNGNASGPFVFAGFRPKWVMIKNSSGSGDWEIFDTSRDIDNIAHNVLLANDSTAEINLSSRELDILSNGFKIRSTAGNVNTSSNAYLYIAFAEHPFKSARAR